MGIITFILSNKKLIGILLLAFAILGVFVYIKNLKSTIEVLEAEKVSIETKLSVSQESVKSLQGAINEQNAAIEKLKTDAEARAKAGQALINKARAEALVHKRRAEDLMKLNPTPGESQCEAAEELINQEIRSAE